MNAQTEYILEITENQCKKMHLTGIFSIDTNKYIYGLRVNHNVKPTTFAGSANLDRRCSGAQYSDPYGTWNNVIVQGTTIITLISYQTAINLEINQIRLKSGTICLYTDTICMDIDGRHTFWKILSTDHCKFNHYNILYEGYANG